MSQIRGSQGATVFARNRGGAYTRNRSRPVQPNTAAQLAVRLAIKQTANAYATALTPSQRQGWSDYAAANPVPNSSGGTMILSAIAMFQKVNMPLVQFFGAGAIVPDAPGAVPFLAALTAGPTMGFAAGVLTLDVINSVPFAVDDVVYSYVTKACSPGRTPVHQPSLPLQFHKLTAVPTTPDNYVVVCTDPFAVSRVDASPYQIRVIWQRGGNIATATFYQGLTAL